MTRPRRVEPGPGQESVWDYPRPPRLEPARRRVRVELGGVAPASRLRARAALSVLWDTDAALRVLETSHPPTYYLPIAELREPARLLPSPRTSVCEFKGRARYWTLEVGDRRAVEVAWEYPEPVAGYEALAGHVAVYPAAMDVCTLDGVPVEPQPGGFYGGWITPDVVGPLKGGPGTMGW